MTIHFDVFSKFFNPVGNACASIQNTYFLKGHALHSDILLFTCNVNFKPMQLIRMSDEWVLWLQYVRSMHCLSLVCMNSTEFVS